MIQLLGGKKKFTEQLDSFFSIKTPNPNKYLGQEAMIGQYAHGNEPSHHIAYLYAFSDKPEKGRKLITQISKEFYNNTPTGMIGNDDCGQMSAWYIFSALGFYPVNPSSGEFVFGMPQVRKAVVNLGKGIQNLVIENKFLTGVNPRIYLNSKKIAGSVLQYKLMKNGGRLVVK